MEERSSQPTILESAQPSLPQKRTLPTTSGQERFLPPELDPDQKPPPDSQYDHDQYQPVLSYTGQLYTPACDPEPQVAQQSDTQHRAPPSHPLPGCQTSSRSPCWSRHTSTTPAHPHGSPTTE